jgi:Fanconi anemia group M protein
MQGMDLTEIRVEVPETIKVLAVPVQELLEEHLEKLRRLGYIPHSGAVGMRALMQSQKRISMAIERGDARGYGAAKTNSDAVRIHNLLGLLLSQGPLTAQKYLERSIEASKTERRGAKRFTSNQRIRTLLSQLCEYEPRHPKLQLVHDLVSERLNDDPDVRIIIFANYRDTMDIIESTLSDIPAAKVEGFFGQAKKDGKSLSQKEQVARLQRFKDGLTNVLIATSVGEEGLDVPSADLVIFHEPVASEIRTIQRRGRTARHREGRVVVLVAEGTRDEGIRHTAVAREARMHKVLARASRRLGMKRLEVSTGKLLASFSVRCELGDIKAATWMMSEVERLAPKLSPSEVINRDQEQAAPQKRKTNDSPAKIRPQQLRPRQQMSIDAFLPPPDTSTMLDDDNEDWSSPVLDGSKEESG